MNTESEAKRLIKRSGMVRRHSIIRNIIGIFCLVLTVALLSSGGFAYFNSRNSMLNQILNDEKESLNHTSRQLEYLIRDIGNLAISVAVDQDMQDYLLSDDFDSYYDHYNHSREVRNMLNMLDVQRDFIYNFVVIKGERIVVSSSQKVITLDENYYGQKIQEQWFKDLLSSERNFYFAPVYPIEGRIDQKILPYVVDVADMDNLSRVVGHILLNIDYNYLQKMMLENSMDLSNFFWLDVNDSMILQKTELTADLSPDIIREKISQTEAGTTVSYKTANGYLIIDRNMSVDWKIAAYIPDSKINRSSSTIIRFFLLYTVVILLIGTILITSTILLMTKPLKSLTQAMHRVSSGEIDLVMPVKRKDEIGELSIGFNNMLADIRGYLAKSVRDEQDKRNFQISLLIAQINPHFIYNTLHTIIYMAKKIDADDIVSMTRAFISVLHDAVRISDGNLMVPLQQELEVVRQYLVIQQYRYRDRFDVEYRLDDTLRACLVPKTILQPIVENALLHGILPDSKAGRIEIDTTADASHLLIRIRDNGNGMPADMIRKILDHQETHAETDTDNNSTMRSIGMQNVNQRIQYLCGDAYGLAISSEPGEFTEVRISLPRIAGQDAFMS